MTNDNKPKPDGGQAFPCHGSYEDHIGMTLRDYFVGQLLAANTKASAKLLFDIAQELVDESLRRRGD